MVAHTITNLNDSEFIIIYNKLALPIDIKNMQKLNKSKYALRKENWFSINKRPIKWKLKKETNNVITKWFIKS